MSNQKAARNELRRMHVDEFLEVIRGLEEAVRVEAISVGTGILLSNILLGVRNGFGE